MVADMLASDPADELLEALRGVLDEFSRRVRQAHSFDEIEAHRDELSELIVSLLSARTTRPGADVVSRSDR
jgi:hypothetical protein